MAATTAVLTSTTRSGLQRSRPARTLAALTLGLLASTSAGLAQPVELPPITVVSPTGIPTPIGQVASSVTVITGEELQRDQRRTLPDALSTVPGLNIVQTGGPGGLTSVFLRGTESNHTKIIIDGIDVSNPSNSGRVFDLGQMLTYDIERIEVLRGPQSGLYGSDAIGGVIWITTKKGEGPPKVTTTIEGGSFGTFNQAGSLSGSQDRFNYSFNVAHFRSASTPVTPLELLPPGQKRNNDYYNNTTYSSRLGFDASDTVSFNWIGRYTDSKLRFTGDVFLPPDFFPAFPAARQSEQVAHQFFTRGEAAVTLFEGRFKNYFGAAYTDHWSHNFNPDGFPTQVSVNKGERTKYDWRGVLDVLPGQILVVGVDQETEWLRTNTTSNENANKGAYAEWQSGMAKRFFFVANIRGDDNDSFGGHSTYRLAPAVIVPVTETKLKGSYGTGFKAPSLFELFGDSPNFVPNPNLRPEQSTGYDIGFEQPIFNRALVGLTYFHNDITDLINFATLPALPPPAPPGTRFTPVNVDKAETEGVEAFAAVNVTDQLKLRADYTYVKAIDALTGLELLRRPRHKTSLTAVWTPTDRLTLSATVLNVSSWQDVDRSTFATITQEGYTVVNLAGNYVVNENVTAFARIDNLLNENYENPNGFLRPGFGIYGGVRLANR